MRTARSWAPFATVLLVGLCLTAESAAQGEPLPGDVAVARAKEGLKHYEAAEWDKAYELFSQADAAAHSVVFRLYMARARRNSGKLLEARTLYRGIAAEQLPANAIPSFTQAQADAKAELAALEPTIPVVLVKLQGASAAATLEIDGVKAAPSQPVALDPGEHRVVAKDGTATVERTIPLRAGDAKLELELTFAADGAGSASGPGALTPRTVRVEGSLAPGIALLATGGASLIAGAVLGGLALGRDGDVTELCPDGVCPSGVDRVAVEDAQSEAQTFAHASTGLLIAGGALAAVGVVLVIVRPGGEDVPAAPSVSVGAGFLGLSWRLE